MLRAGAVVLDASRVVPRAEIAIAGGRVVSIERAERLTRSEQGLVVTAGLVDAHAHLDLGALAGSTEPGGGFLDWVGRIVAARSELGAVGVARGVRRSADALLDGGATAVIDIVGSDDVERALDGVPLRTVLLREVIDGSPAGLSERSEEALLLARRACARTQTELRAFGVSPHGTHTVGDALLAAVAALRPPAPVAVHWAETPEERLWLSRGEGPFAGWLGPSPRCTGSERLRAAGLLEGALLVHGNDPAPGEVERIAAAGAAVVHCPGSHAYFGRPQFDAERYVAAGVPLALGTDSWASNERLDMRREVRLARETLGLDGPSVWRAATEAGAAHLPWQHVTGRVEVGSAADLALFALGDIARAAADRPDRILDALTLEEPEIAGLYVAGDVVRG
ncbi:MAG: amidohydrolase family protein [Planctomycetota bacterium]